MAHDLGNCQEELTDSSSSSSSPSSPDNEGRQFAQELALKLRAKLSREELILPYAGRFCRSFFAEFRNLVPEFFSEELLMESIESTNGVDGHSLHRQDSDEQSDGVVSPVICGVQSGTRKSWEASSLVSDQDYSCSTSDLNSLAGFHQETTCHGDCRADGKRRSSAVSLQSNSVNLNCSSCQSKSLVRRRLSFRGLNPFHRRGSEPKPDRNPFAGATSAASVLIPSSGSSGPVMKRKHDGDIRVTRIEMTVEILREDLCTFLVMDNAPSVAHHGQSSRWESCRLTLAKSPVGHLLQIFAPAKSIKAKKSIFCAAIKEARDATESNALGHDCVFIIQLIDGSQYMFRMETSEEKRSWVYEMQRSGVAEAKIPGSVFPLAGSNSVRPRLSTFPPSEPRRITPETNYSIPVSSVSGVSVTPCVTDVVATVSRKNSLVMSPSRTGTPTVETPLPFTSVNPMTHGFNSERSSLTESLATFPWYHRAITRNEAAALVVGTSALASLDAAHGRFLIRASETRPGEFVVTFNAYGKPKHLRIFVDANGQCRVQSLWFDSVQSMTEHYRMYPLPLESGHSSDVKLTECIPSTANSGRARSGSFGSALGDPPCRSASMLHLSSSDSRFKTTQCPCIDEESKRAL